MTHHCIDRSPAPTPLHLDNDGDQDLFGEVDGFYPVDTYPNVLFENPGGTSNHWVTLELENVKANKSAMGACLRVDLATPADPHSLYFVVRTGGRFGGNSPQQEIGLGDAHLIKRIVMQRPGSGTKQAVPGPTMDSFWKLREDATECATVKRTAFQVCGGEQLRAAKRAYRCGIESPARTAPGDAVGDSFPHQYACLSLCGCAGIAGGCFPRQYAGDPSSTP